MIARRIDEMCVGKKRKRKRRLTLSQLADI